jgi:hypothetical protein
VEISTVSRALFPVFGLSAAGPRCCTKARIHEGVDPGDERDCLDRQPDGGTVARITEEPDGGPKSRARGKKVGRGQCRSRPVI